MLARRRPIYLAFRRALELVAGVPLLYCIGAACRLFKCQERFDFFYKSSRQIWNGEIGLVGPSEQMKMESGGILQKGVFSEAEISRRAGLETDATLIDAEYGRRFGPLRDFGILLRSAWTSILWNPPQAIPGRHFNLLGVFVNNSTVPLILETIRDIVTTHPNTQMRMRSDGASNEHWASPAHVCFVNAHNFNMHMQMSDYRYVLREAELVLPDGIGVNIALRMAGGKLQRNLNGTDLFPPLAEWLSRETIPVFILGAEHAVLATAVAKIERIFSDINIAGSHSGYFTEDQEQVLCDKINSSGALVVIVGMGTPRQEIWYKRNAARLKVAVVFSMGGLLDFLGEKNKRAPGWMRHSGFEWLYRLLQEPQRMWRRYIIGNPLFLYRAWRWNRNRHR